MLEKVSQVDVSKASGKDQSSMSSYLHPAPGVGALMTCSVISRFPGSIQEAWDCAGVKAPAQEVFERTEAERQEKSLSVWRSYLEEAQGGEGGVVVDGWKRTSYRWDKFSV